MSISGLRAGLTPVKAPGKRNCDPAFKKRQSKRQKIALRTSYSSSKLLFQGSAQVEDARHRRKNTRGLSPLENLPLEIIQDIFKLSGNLSLPSVSPSLLQDLCKNEQLHQSVADATLNAVLGFPSSESTAELSRSDVRAAIRLLDSRFFTWEFFKKWLCRKSSRAIRSDSEDLKKLWHSLHPHIEVIPPPKVFLPPYVDEKVNFFEILNDSNRTRATADRYSQYEDQIKEIIEHAVKTNNIRTVRLMLTTGIFRVNEPLYIAVEDNDCSSWEIIESLMQYSLENQSQLQARGLHCEEQALPFLDPILWNWADRARERGDPNGRRLKALMRQFSSDFTDRGTG